MYEFELDDLKAFDRNLDNWASANCFSFDIWNFLLSLLKLHIITFTNIFKIEIWIFKL